MISGVISKERTRTDRFDEAFKTLLVVVSLVFSSTLAFYRGTWQPDYFVGSGLGFIITVVVYVVSTLHGGNDEYIFKVFGWYFLMFSFGTTFVRMIFIGEATPPMILSVIMIAVFALTIPIARYLRETIGRGNYKPIMIALLVMTLFMVALNVLENSLRYLKFI